MICCNIDYPHRHCFQRHSPCHHAFTSAFYQKVKNFHSAHYRKWITRCTSWWKHADEHYIFTCQRKCHTLSSLFVTISILLYKQKSHYLGTYGIIPDMLPFCIELPLFSFNPARVGPFNAYNNPWIGSKWCGCLTTFMCHLVSNALAWTYVPPGWFHVCEKCLRTGCSLRTKRNLIYMRKHSRRWLWNRTISKVYCSGIYSWMAWNFHLDKIFHFPCTCHMAWNKRNVSDELW